MSTKYFCDQGLLIDNKQEKILKYLYEVDSAPTYELASITLLQPDDFYSAIRELQEFELISVDDEIVTLEHQGKKIVNQYQKAHASGSYFQK